MVRRVLEHGDVAVATLRDPLALAHLAIREGDGRASCVSRTPMGFVSLFRQAMYSYMLAI